MNADDRPASGKMAQTALWLSVFAFIVPLGIAAVVIGHICEKQSEENGGDSDPTARAALWIGYLQLALVSVTAVIAWGLFHETAQGFRRDAVVQRFFRASDQMQPLDAESAREEEQTAASVVYQLVAIEDEMRRHREDGSYACQIEELLENGAEGATDAEKRAFGMRVMRSAYMYRISRCNPQHGGVTDAAYVLTAVPRTPRMPDTSTIFCTDQTGSVRYVRGGTSLECLNNGEAFR